MHKPDFAEFRGMLDRCASIFAAKKPDDERVQLYWDALADLPIETIRQAVKLHQRHGKYFPKPSELRPKADKTPSVDDPAKRAEFDEKIRRSCERWDQRLKEEPLLGKWEILDAYMMNRDNEDQSSLVHAEKIQFARDAFRRLLAESGEDYIGKHWVAWRLAIRFEPSLCLTHPMKPTQ